MKQTVVTLTVIVAVLVGCHKSESNVNVVDTDTKEDRIGKALVNSALQVSGLDASVLSGISEKLKNSCDRNRFGLSEEACIQMIETRKDICTQETAQKYPGQISNTGRMQEVATSYVNCLFQQ